MGIVQTIKNFFKKKEEKGVYVIYTTKKDIDLNSIFKKFGLEFDKETDVTSIIKSQYVSLIGENYKVILNQIDRTCPIFFEQIESLPAYIMQLAKPDKMDSRLFGLFTKISQINHILSIVVEPSDKDEFGFNFAVKLLKEVKGILLYKGLIFDDKMALYIGPDGKNDDNSELYYYEDAKNRKAKTISLLNEKGFKTIEHLPTVVSEEELNLRDVSDVAKRALVLSILSSKVDNLSMEEVKLILEKYKLMESLTEKETNFLNNPNPEEQDLINFKWNIESSKTLLWSIGFIDKLDFPSDTYKVEDVIKSIFEETPQKIIENAKFRNNAEILDQLDMMYRLNWLITDEKLKDKEAKLKNINDGVVYERHRALNWLTYTGNNEWDNIRIDT